MNIVAICLHRLDMRDFHSNLQDTPFLDSLRSNAVVLPLKERKGTTQLIRSTLRCPGV